MAVLEEEVEEDHFVVEDKEEEMYQVKIQVHSKEEDEELVEVTMEEGEMTQIFYMRTLRRKMKVCFLLVTFKKFKKNLLMMFGAGPDETEDDISESFSFALLNGALGVFEVQGRRIRDFRPKWPSSSFALSDGLVTAMAYDLPHVVMGDRNILYAQMEKFLIQADGKFVLSFKSRLPKDLHEGTLEAILLQALAQGTEMQLSLVVESQNATLSVKRRLACE
ncbi:hypothetical protein POM88_031016 [Heracleum sosnowskyi]|uniref:WDR11 second beta-propeller domain-containing protein n=1 Tax=Heracleum sosnowskyi TaxID=360622 RepID=A0AAD8MJX0_9APIA|nr:hypothetical protein POM88_031016 [Heracleum sosnowskyi]